MTIRGILFDKDGTLFDFFRMWQPAYLKAATAVAEFAGRPELAPDLLRAGGFDPEAGELDPASPLASGTNDDIAAIWTALAGVGDEAACAALIHDVFRTESTKAQEPVTDLVILFSRLKSRGLALGVATMDSTAAARDMIGAAGALELLDFVTGFDGGHGAKPDPELVRGFCRATDRAATEVAVVGDTLADMKMSRAAGAGLTVGVLTGASPRHVLADIADHVIPSIAEIETVLG